MKIWNVSPIFNRKNQLEYIVLPYNIKEIILLFLQEYKISEILYFVKNCRLTEISTKKYANIKNNQHDIEW